MLGVQQESSSSTPVPDATARGVQDVSGWGLAGLTLGIVAGFAASFYWLVPLFPKVRTTGNITLMTVLVVAAMTLGGTIGYLATRRKVRPHLD